MQFNAYNYDDNWKGTQEFLFGCSLFRTLFIIKGKQIQHSSFYCNIVKRELINDSMPKREYEHVENETL